MVAPLQWHKQRAAEDKGKRQAIVFSSQAKRSVFSPCRICRQRRANSVVGVQCLWPPAPATDPGQPSSVEQSVGRVISLAMSFSWWGEIAWIGWGEVGTAAGQTSTSLSVTASHWLQLSVLHQPLRGRTAMDGHVRYQTEDVELG